MSSEECSSRALQLIERASKKNDRLLARELLARNILTPDCVLTGCHAKILFIPSTRCTMIAKKEKIDPPENQFLASKCQSLHPLGGNPRA